MLGRAHLTLCTVMHEFRKSLSQRCTTSCRGDDDDKFRDIVHTGDGQGITLAGTCHAGCAQSRPMVTRLFALMLLASATLAAAEPQAPALLAFAPAAVDWKTLACAALVALYVARRRSHWHTG